MGPVLVAQLQRRHRTQGAARAIADKRKAGRVDAEQAGIVEGPVDRMTGRHHRRREGMFRRQPIIDRQHRRPDGSPARGTARRSWGYSRRTTSTVKVEGNRQNVVGAREMGR